jgi:hypothetical protein
MKVFPSSSPAYVGLYRKIDRWLDGEWECRKEENDEGCLPVRAAEPDLLVGLSKVPVWGLRPSQGPPQNHLLQLRGWCQCGVSDLARGHLRTTFCN